MPPPQLPRVEELEFWSTGEKMGREKFTSVHDTVTINADTYEKLLQASKAAGSAESKGPANAGPFGLFGLFITTLAFSCVELNMGGSNGMGGIMGSLFFTGPIPLLFACVSEWYAGSFFAFVVYGAMGIFWISLGFVFYLPTGIMQSYSPTGNAAEGVASAAFNSDLGLWLVGWGLALFVILICSIRTNITFVILFTILDAGFFIFAASHFQMASGNSDVSNILTKVGAGCTFTVGLMLFYLLCMTMFDEMGVPIHLPIGDLNAPPPELPFKDISIPQGLDQKHHHHHDEESQMYSQRISLPLQR